MEPALGPSAAPRPARIDVRALVEALPVPVLLIGADDDLLASNAAGFRLFGRPQRECKKFKDLPLSYEIHGLRLELEKVKVGHGEATLIGVIWSVDGRDVHLDVTLSPVHGLDGAVQAVVLTAVDRTELLSERSRREALRAEHADLLARQDESATELEALNNELTAANEELREQVRKLAAAEEADIRKNQFMAMLAHELRNPLGAAVNALHVIRRAAGVDRQIHQATRIAERQLRHEARLLDDLLDVSRIVFGKIVVQSRPVDLRASVRAAVEGADHAALARAIAMGVDLPDDPLVVTGDATRLEQCVGNLLSNAIKFTPPGGTVTIQARRDAGQALVTIRDSGIGISAEMLGRVFDPFMQANASLARAQGGLGIGLTLVRHLVELHGGTVTARSAGAGRGSEFEIRLPLSDRLVVPPEPEADADVRPRHILVVEDNRDARDMLRTVLQLQGHTVSDTGDGTSAVRMASESGPEVVVLDIGLPDLDGFEVARRIRKRLGSTVRIIGLSGYGDDEARRAGRDAGFDAHLVKPVSPEALLRALDWL